jgi:polar amino acid transport system permease protein
MYLASTFSTLLSGVPVTLEVTVLAGLLTVVASVIAGAGRLSRRRVIRFLAGVYIEVFRGSSAIVQLYIAYYALPLWGLTLTPLTAGVVVLGLNAGAYGAEVVRGAILAVPQEQREAATALSIRSWPTFRRVIFPQALTIILPSMGNLLIDLLKTSSLVSLVTLSDVTFQAQQLRLTSGKTAAIFGLTLLIYLVLASVIDVGVKWAERRVGRGFRTHRLVGPTLWQRLRQPVAAHGRVP